MANVALTAPTVGEAAEDCARDGKPAEEIITAADAEEETADVPEFGGSCYGNSFCSH